jgi:peroxiredoxin Q/BCP
MSEPVLRRSSRNAAKKDLPIPTPPVHVQKKRTAVEPKKPTVKKVKMTVDRVASAVNVAVGNRMEMSSSSQIIAAPGGAETTKTSRKAAPTSSNVKPNSKSFKPKKGEEVAVVGLKEGDFLPKDLPEVQTEDGVKTTIIELLETARKGIIIFAYPKAATVGCITQACLFRDNFSAFSEAGFTVYGMSGDLPASNEKFKTKQNLTYTLLCDPTYALHEKFAIKKKPKGTIRSVIIIEKTAEDGHTGKILRSSPASPQISLLIAKEVVGIDDASNIAAAAEAKEAEKMSASKDTIIPVSTPAVDFTG